MTAAGPRTAAGRALLLDWEEWRQSVGKSAGRDDPFAMRERLAAVEAEAAAPIDVEALARALDSVNVPIPWPHDRNKQAAAILAELERARG